MTDRLTDLANEWINQKAIEADARSARIAIEEHILLLIETKEEGSITTAAGDYKITATTKTTRRLVKDWQSILNDSGVDQLLWPIQIKHDIDLAGVRYLMDKEPEVYARVAQAIEAKPAKPSIVIKEGK